MYRLDTSMAHFSEGQRFRSPWLPSSSSCAPDIASTWYNVLREAMMRKC